MAYLRKTLHSLGGGTPIGEEPFRQALAYAQFMRAAAPRAAGGVGDDDTAARLAIAQLQQEGLDRRQGVQQEGYRAYRDAMQKKSDRDTMLRLALARMSESARQDAAARQDARSEDTMARFMAAQQATQARYDDAAARASEREEERRRREDERALLEAGEKDRKDWAGAGDRLASLQKKLAAGDLEPDAASEGVDVALRGVGALRTPGAQRMALGEAESFARAADASNTPGSGWVASGVMDALTHSAIPNLAYALIPFFGMNSKIPGTSEPRSMPDYNARLGNVQGNAANMEKIARFLAASRQQQRPSPEVEEILRAALARAGR